MLQRCCAEVSIQNKILRKRDREIFLVTYMLKITERGALKNRGEEEKKNATIFCFNGLK
jgi:hypothetical protein